MTQTWYRELVRQSLTDRILDEKTCMDLLVAEGIDLLLLMQAAFTVREKTFGRTVSIHILNNVKNGRCPEDCNYCAQSSKSDAPIETYATKDDDEILEEASQAYLSGAHRYCMVYAGQGASDKRISRLVHIIRAIKEKFPLEVCVSTGIVTEQQAVALKEAGLDRLNHNLNTAPSRYATICTTHGFSDRVATLEAARRAGLSVCSGIIAGMGETPEEIVALGRLLRSFEVHSIPVNFLLPVPGIQTGTPQGLSPAYCLKILALFRFLNPTADIRAAAGREYHLRSLEHLCLYPANSIFMDGYLNTHGASRKKTLQMIKDSGFTLQSNLSVDELLQQEQGILDDESGRVYIKNKKTLRPALL